MALPVIAGVYRCAFDWDQNVGIKPVNVIHVRAVAGTEADIAGAIYDAFQVDQFGMIPAIYSITSITVTKLDGASAGVPVAPTGAHNGHGVAVADPIAGEAVVMSFQTGLRGAAHRGRAFLGPVAENLVSGGQYQGDVAALSGIWADFQTALQATDPSVSHVVASYLHAEAHDVTNYNARVPLGSSRSRLLQVR